MVASTGRTTTIYASTKAALQEPHRDAGGRARAARDPRQRGRAGPDRDAPDDRHAVRDAGLVQPADAARRRLRPPEDIADVIAFLASGDARLRDRRLPARRRRHEPRAGAALTRAAHEGELADWAPLGRPIRTGTWAEQAEPTADRVERAVAEGRDDEARALVRQLPVEAEEIHELYTAWWRGWPSCSASPIPTRPGTRRPGRPGSRDVRRVDSRARRSSRCSTPWHDRARPAPAAGGRPDRPRGRGSGARSASASCGPTCRPTGSRSTARRTARTSRGRRRPSG